MREEWREEQQGEMGDNGETVGRMGLRMGKEKGRRGKKGKERGQKEKKVRKKGMRKGGSRSKKVGDSRKGTQDKDARM